MKLGRPKGMSERTRTEVMRWMPQLASQGTVDAKQLRVLMRQCLKRGESRPTHYASDKTYVDSMCKAAKVHEKEIVELLERDLSAARAGYSARGGAHSSKGLENHFVSVRINPELLASLRHTANRMKQVSTAMQLAFRTQIVEEERLKTVLSQTRFVWQRHYDQQIAVLRNMAARTWTLDIDAMTAAVQRARRIC